MKHLRKSWLIFAITVLVWNCNNPGKNITKTQDSSNSVTDTKSLKSLPVLPSLEAEEIHVTDKLFGTTIELTGTPINIKENLRPHQLLVKDKYLIINNYRTDSIFMIFELPGFKCVASFGYKGRGPEEFISPLIVKTLEDSVLCYIYEKFTDKVYKISRDRLYPEYYITLPKQKHDFGDKQIIFIDNKSAYYSATSENTKNIYYFSNDSLPQEKIVKDLEISGYKGTWATVIGDFGINTYYGRIAYAYKYFKRLKIIDIQTMKERNIIFDAIELRKGLNGAEIGEPTNITHFWGMSPNDKYFWMLYSGRSPIDVQTDNRNKKKYIFVEKYDWNGNPLKKYKLDDWGYFCVDEERNILYLASTAGINSLIKYDISGL